MGDVIQLSKQGLFSLRNGRRVFDFLSDATRYEV
ncbi:hypothetical protein KIPB_009447, partial [Kipferlia bialata]|eukprot:g9447.t1